MTYYDVITDKKKIEVYAKVANKAMGFRFKAWFQIRIRLLKTGSDRSHDLKIAKYES